MKKSNVSFIAQICELILTKTNPFAEINNSLNIN